MSKDKTENRKLRKAELEKLTVAQLGEIKPYEKGRVSATKTERPNKISKAEMIETILNKEGLWATR